MKTLISSYEMHETKYHNGNYLLLFVKRKLQCLEISYDDILLHSHTLTKK